MSRDVYIVVVGLTDGRFCEDSLASSKCLEMCILWLLDLDGRFCEDSLASSKCLEMCILWLLDI